MAVEIDARIVELLAARLCHDLIGPVSAIGNGAELLSDDDPDFVRDAVALIGDSARKALRRLQFYRFAFGFRPGGVVSAAPHALVAELFEGSGVVCDYPDAVRQLPLEWQKLSCNLVAVAADALPRGGTLRIGSEPGGLAVEATGEGSGPSTEICEALALASAVDDLTPRSVGAYLAGILGRQLGCRVWASGEPGLFRIDCAP